MKTMSILTCPVSRDAWAQELAETNGVASPLDDASSWEPCERNLAQFRQLGDDWDGCGAKAPSGELLASAVGLAHLLRDQGVPAPSRVVPGLDGIVLFEWQFPDGTYAELELIRPLFAEGMLIEPGQPAKHWTLPTE